MKYVILLVGTSAVGKSTVREILVPKPYKKWESSHKDRLWEESESKKGWVYLGKGKAGSETIKTIELYELALKTVLNFKDIIVVDTVRISNAWPMLLYQCLKKHFFKIILVHFDLSKRTIRRRLETRRKKLGLKPYNSSVANQRQDEYTRSTINAIDAFVKSNIPHSVIKIEDSQMSAQTVAWKITEVIK